MDGQNRSFQYELFIMHHSSSGDIAARLAERLRREGFAVYRGDSEAVHSGSGPPEKEAPMVNSRILLLLFTSDMLHTEGLKLGKNTALFRDPKEEERIFIPFLLDDCKLPEFMRRYRHIDAGQDFEGACRELILLLQALCPKKSLSEKEPGKEGGRPPAHGQQRILGHRKGVWSVAGCGDEQCLSGSTDNTVKLWDIERQTCLRTLSGHESFVRTVTALPESEEILSGSEDKTIKLWDRKKGECLKTISGHDRAVICLAVIPGARKIVSGSNDCTLKLWDLDSGDCLLTFTGHEGGIWAAAITPDGKYLISASADRTVKLWDIRSGKCLKTLKGHKSSVSCLAVTPDGKHLLSGSYDVTLKLWEIENGKCVASFEGHQEPIWSVAVSPAEGLAASASMEHNIKLWDLASGACLQTLQGDKDFIHITFNHSGSRLIAGSDDGAIHTWRVEYRPRGAGQKQPAGQIRLTTAKVVMVGNPGSGKTSLARRLEENRWQEGDNPAHGTRIITLKQPLTEPGEKQEKSEREILLWDFASQPEYHLAHRLFLDDTALALLFLDPGQSNPLQSLEKWENALRAALKEEPPKVLVATKNDLEQAAVTPQELEAFCREHSYRGLVYTSAKENEGLPLLREAIVENIRWDKLPWTSTTTFTASLQDIIARIKQEGILLIRFSELRQQVRLSLPGEKVSAGKVRGAVKLLANKGLLKPLDFGDFILLEPERLNSYAAAVIRAAYRNEKGLGCILEQEFLKGDFQMEQRERLSREDEEILLWALRQAFLDQFLCIREDTPCGKQLVFPSRSSREMPEIPGCPNITVIYRFCGDLESIYNTLAVKLCYSNAFEKKDLWKNAAEFLTAGGRTAGFKMDKISEAKGAVSVFFAAGVAEEDKVTFIKYIHEHLLKHSLTVERERVYNCPKCNYPATDHQVIDLRRQLGKDYLICNFCDAKIPLNDLIEKKFSGDRLDKEIREIDSGARLNMDRESRELAMVGQAYVTAKEAGQICRIYTNPNNGIDGEIEFTDNDGSGNGKKIYLQLRPDNAYYDRAKGDSQRILTIKNEWHIEHWQSQPHPVFLLMRAENREIQWMNVSEHLRNRNNKRSKQIVFAGEPFNIYSLLLLRERLNENNLFTY